MNLYKGKLVVDLVTAVETNSEEKMTEKAHEKFTSELFDELMALVGANGFLINSIGADLVNIGEANEVQLKLIESSTEEAEEKAKDIYNKANIITYRIQL